MTKIFQSVDEMIGDELFMAWYQKRSEAEVAEFEQWLLQNPSQKPMADEAVALMDELQLKETTISTDQVEERLKALQSQIDDTQAPVVTMHNRRRWWLSAAAILILAIGGFTYFKLNQSKEVLGTPYGQIASNQLPDGSTMILNANSTATLSEGWTDGKDREVWLNGEAFFKVTKTAQKSRFIVHTGNLDIIVTGTQFNVQHRDNRTTVLLTEGSVILRTSDGEELAMKPGDYVVMADKSIEKKESNADNVLAWKSNMIAFENSPLTEVATLIKHHYGVNVTLADDSVAKEKVTGLMSNNNLDDLLKAIEIASEIRITRNDNGITFSTNN